MQDYSSFLLSLLALTGIASIIVVIIVLAVLSQRLGAVTKRKPIFRWYYVGAAFVAVGLIAHVVALVFPSALSRDLQTLLIDVPIMIGLVIAVVIGWQYWSWLLSERGTGG